MAITEYSAVIRSLTGSILTWEKLETATHSRSDALATHAESTGSRAMSYTDFTAIEQTLAAALAQKSPDARRERSR